jgi:Protein of unknown function (DUF3365)
LIFCSTRAIPLTDSMSVALNAKVRRVSDRNRNPQNKANKRELAVINAMKEAIAAGKEPQAQLLNQGKKYVGYYPIITNPMCLQCHGKPTTDITAQALSRIKQNYPQDRAVGYQLNELRGVFVVVMDKK